MNEPEFASLQETVRGIRADAINRRAESLDRELCRRMLNAAVSLDVEGFGP